MAIKKYLLKTIIVFLIILFFCTAVLPAEKELPLTLEESIEIALKHSVIINAAKEGVRASESKKKGAFTGFLPKLSTSYSYKKLHEAPESKLTESPVTAGTKNNYRWELELKQPIFAGGSILANYQINMLGEDISRMEEKATILNIIQEVKEAYFNILKTERIMGVARQSVEQLKMHRDVAKNFYDVGIIPKNDLLYAEVELANGNQFLVRAENRVELARAKFNTVLRRGINAPVKIEDILCYKPFQKDAADCVKIALENRPEIKVYSMKVEQAEKQVKMTKSGFLPSLDLVGNYSRFGDDPDMKGSQYEDQENWHIMAVANWDIWEWGRTKHKVDSDLSRKNQAADELVAIEDRIALDVKSYYLFLKEAEKHIFVAKKTIEQAEENFRINEERYKERVATSTDVIDAQTLLTRAKSDYYNALSNYNIALARLERSMGVGKEIAGSRQETGDSRQQVEE
ncbi:MAG: TolC family protein [Syntrophales bacterium]|nr:TolC family protein [Syntrophales bacterium]